MVDNVSHLDWTEK